MTNSMLVASHRSEWFHEHEAHFGAMNMFSSTIASWERRHPGSIPSLRGQSTLLIGSDYSGFHAGAAFEVTSLLITNLDSLGPWDERRRHVRKRYLPGQRRMAYKALNDNHRRAGLLPFLETANQIPGLLLTIAIDRNVSTMFDIDIETGERVQSYPLFEGWKLAPVERAMRTVHFASLLLRGLSGPGQDVWWFTDQDEIVANKERLQSFVSLVANVSSHYLPHTIGRMKIGTTASDTGRRDIEDFVAIPDLAAGALQEVFSGLASQVLQAPSIFAPSKQELRPKTRRIMDWFSDNTQLLRRLTLVVDKPAEGKLRITSLRFHGSQDADADHLVSLG